MPNGFSNKLLSILEISSYTTSGICYSIFSQNFRITFITKTVLLLGFVADLPAI